MNEIYKKYQVNIIKVNTKFDFYIFINNLSDLNNESNYENKINVSDSYY